MNRRFNKYPLPWKIGYSDGSGINSRAITDANDNTVVWGESGEDAATGPRDAQAAALIVWAANQNLGKDETEKTPGVAKANSVRS